MSWGVVFWSLAADWHGYLIVESSNQNSTKTPAKAVDRSGGQPPFARVKRVSLCLLEPCGSPMGRRESVAHDKCRARSSLMRTTAELATRHGRLRRVSGRLPATSERAKFQMISWPMPVECREIPPDERCVSLQGIAAGSQRLDLTRYPAMSPI